MIRPKDIAERCPGRMKQAGGWCVAQMKALGSRCVELWQLWAEKYQAQQEVIKRQSEVSHERITLKRAVLTFMETWGLGSRNIFYTAWHLLWRPGYVIVVFA